MAWGKNERNVNKAIVNVLLPGMRLIVRLGWADDCTTYKFSEVVVEEVVECRGVKWVKLVRKPFKENATSIWVQPDAEECVDDPFIRAVLS